MAFPVPIGERRPRHWLDTPDAEARLHSFDELFQPLDVGLPKPAHRIGATLVPGFRILGCADASSNFPTSQASGAGTIGGEGDEVG